MERSNRTVLIIVIVVAALFLCCCVVAAGATLTGLLTSLPLVSEGGITRVEERTEQSFAVGTEPTLEVKSFAGKISVRAGEGDQIRIIATKKAAGRNVLDRINVDVSELANGARIETSHARGLTANVSVDLEITVPADADLDLRTGAGKVEVDGIEGRISAQTGAGSVEVRGAAGPVALDTGAGEIDYEGEPRGDCSFSTGAGSVTLRLDEDLDVEIDLSTGVGNISLGGFDIQGDTSGTEVQGVIGTGDEATIEAHTGVGSVNLIRR